MLATIGSAVFHAALMAVILYAARQVPVRLRPMSASIGTATQLAALTNGSGEQPVKIASVYTPPHASQTAVTKTERAEKKTPAAPAPDPSVAMAQKQSSSPVVAQQAKQGGASEFGASGADFATLRVALPDNAPRPKVDLSALPQGKEGDVVLDATIDAQGHVQDVQLISSMGYGVEQSVMDTVRGWTFKPATRDGVPIAIVQELHFHYGPRG